MGRVSAILGGILVLAILAGGLTEATLVLGHHGRIADDSLLRPNTPKTTSSPSPSSTPTSSPSPSAKPVTTPTPTPTPVVPTATTNAFVHMRADKSIYSNILIDLNGGTKVQLLPDSNAQWQQVRYNGLTGYIFKAYLTY